MSYLLTIRQQLGISQPDFAVLLSISRANLNMVERGERNLTAQSLQLVLKLETALSTRPVAVTKKKKVTRLKPTLANELEALNEWCMQKGRHYLQVAQQIETRYRQCENCLQVLPQVFTQEIIDAAEDERLQLMLNIIYRTCKLQQKKFPLTLAQQCTAMGNKLIGILG